MSAARPVLVTVPDAGFIDSIGPVEGAELRVWDLADDAPASAIDLVVAPAFGAPRPLREALDGVSVGLLQLQAIGYDMVIGRLPPGISVANAASVHEPATAELAVTLALALLRGVPGFVRDAAAGAWSPARRPGLADHRVMLLGYGGIGQALERRLAGFEVELVRVASRARTSESGAPVHGVDELPALLPTVDVVIVAVPLSPASERLVDADFLAALPDDAVVVNVARGRVADTEAILAEARSGRLLFGLDTVDPEPLPSDHPLWSLPNVLVTPHVGGLTEALRPRLIALLRDQIDRLVRGEAPRNVVHVSEAP